MVLEQLLPWKNDYDFTETLALLLDYAATNPDKDWLVSTFLFLAMAYDWALLAIVAFVVSRASRRSYDTRDKKLANRLRKAAKRTTAKSKSSHR